MHPGYCHAEFILSEAEGLAMTDELKTTPKYLFFCKNLSLFPHACAGSNFSAKTPQKFIPD
jgi:hypothetical protein